MKTIGFALATALLLPIPVHAQSAPRAEVFGGYSFARVRGLGDTHSPDRNLNGWVASAVFSPLDWFGIEGSVSGHYGRGGSTVALQPIPGIPDASYTTRTSTSMYTFTVGPRFSARGNRITGYCHVLAGASRYRRDISLSLSYVPQPDPVISGTFKQTRFAVRFGGGVDLKATDRIAVRLVEVDYLLTPFEGQYPSSVQNGIRLSAGIVFAFGRR